MKPSDKTRRQGVFYTPQYWAEEAHKFLAGHLGPSWEEECLVWDPAAGSGNLTRGHTFSNLILSTLEFEDIPLLGAQQGLSFQYDFLNPGEEDAFGLLEAPENKLPEEVSIRLRQAAGQGKRLVFFMNPPYAAVGNARKEGDYKVGVSHTVVGSRMRELNFDAGTRQLYLQFLFQCSQLAFEFGFKQHTIACFSKHSFLCSSAYKPFRDWWYKRYKYQGGFLFPAEAFAEVSARWGVAFTVWDAPGRTSGDLEIQVLDGEKRHPKSIYNSDGREAAEWLREPVRGLVGTDAPQLSSGLVVKHEGRGVTGSLGFMVNHTNNRASSGDMVFLLSSAYVLGRRNGGGVLEPGNWERAVALFAARKLAGCSWETEKDEFLIPETKKQGYQQWVNDCHVYALLNPANNATALVGLLYQGKGWTVHNPWFWREPAYLGCLLQELSLSPDAQHVLDLLNALWEKSMPVREAYAAGKPELHLLAWDAGVYQLKHLWRDLFPAEWVELKEAHRKLALRLADGVYEYGFLKR